MDDNLYVTGHPLLHDPHRLWKTWFAPGSFIEYYPIEETLLYLQWRILGPDTLGYHLTNVFLHIANGLLVWRLLEKFGLRWAWLGGLLFVVHPAQVESVAWIAELKNCLSLLPFLVAMIFWIDYEEHRQPRDYAFALGLFTIAMLCKISMAPFPFVILLYAWWKRGSIGWGDLKAALPFLVIAVLLALLTLRCGEWFLQLHRTLPPVVVAGGFSERVARGGICLAFYLSQFFWPVDLSPLHPLWAFDPHQWREFLPWLIFLAGSIWFWTQRKTWGRHAILGLGFFILMITPFLGFNTVSYQNFTWVMDHFLYLPVIGLIGLVIAALGQIANQLSPGARVGGAGVVALALLVLTAQSHAYAAVFSSSVASNGYVIARYPGMWTVRNNLGEALRQEGRIAEAEAQLREAERIRPTYSAPFNNLGGLLMLAGRYPEAIAQFQEAIRLQPDYPEALAGLGNTLVLSGKTADAVPYYRTALKSDPDYAKAHNSLGNALLQLGQLDEARAECEKSIQLNPDYTDAYCTLGLVLFQQGDLDGALTQFQIAHQIDPINPHIRKGLEWLQGLKNGNGGAP